MAVKNNIPSQRHDSVFGTITIVNADASTYKTIYAPTASDNSKEAHIFSISVVSDDSVSRDLMFAINDGTTDIPAGALAIPPLSGESVIAPPVSVIANRAQPVFTRALKDSNGNWYVMLRPGETLKVKSLTTVTSTKTIRITAVGWNFTRS